MSDYPASRTQSGRLADFARQHPTLVLTAGYVVLTLVGLVYSAWLFLYFRINIIEYFRAERFPPRRGEGAARHPARDSSRSDCFARRKSRRVGAPQVPALRRTIQT